MVDLHNLYTWGRGTHGKLGLGTKDNQNSPQLVNEFVLKRIVDVNAGYWQSVALTEKGAVFVWGSHKNGQLGLGDSCDEEVHTPTLLPFFEDIPVQQIDCADGFCAVVTSKQSSTLIRNAHQMSRKQGIVRLGHAHGQHEPSSIYISCSTGD